MHARVSTLVPPQGAKADWGPSENDLLEEANAMAAVKGDLTPKVDVSLLKDKQRIYDIDLTDVATGPIVLVMHVTPASK